MTSLASFPPPNPPLDGMEVPIPGSDKVRWIELTVPSSPRPASPPESSPGTFSRNAAACHVIPGDDLAYIIWRIHKDIPNAVELIEIYPHREFPESGLRLIFPESLFPFAFVCRDENASGTRYLLYALTESGTAYLFKVGSLSSYVSGSVFSQSDFIQFVVERDPKITAVGATFGSLLIGRQDGSVTCYKLGILERSAPGFVTEFRDDVGMGRLWSLVSRGRTIAVVKDLLISQVCGRKLIFVLHLDGTLRVWDLMNHTKVLNHNTFVKELTGSTTSRVWVGDPNYDTSIIPVAVLYEYATNLLDRLFSADPGRFGWSVCHPTGYPLEPGLETIALHYIHFGAGDKITLSTDSSVQIIPLDRGRLVDLILTKCKLWILKEDGSMMYDLFHSNINMEHVHSYGLQEDFISDQLFQGPDQPSDDLIWNEPTMLSSIKEQFPYIISSIFLHRLLQPGIHHSAALRATILDHRKYLTDFEFRSLNVASLKKEIFSIIESEGVAVNPISMFHYWKNFCAQFFRHWSETNTAYCLFVDSSNGSIGLIRKGSVSIFRNLEHSELLIYGSYDEICYSNDADKILLHNDLERDIIFDVLKCMGNVNHQLGRAASAAIFMSLINPENFSFDDIVSHLVKIMETGYCSPITTPLTSQIGVDATWEKRQADHRSHRKFAVEMMLSLRELHAKAITWERVLNIVEKYLHSLIPNCLQSLDTEPCFNINSSLLVQAASQMAKVMLESSFDILLLLRYLVNINMQVNIGKNDISRIVHRLIPLTQDVIMHWLTIYFTVTTPTESLVFEDFSSRLSSLHIANETDKISLDGKLGTPDFMLACLLDFPISLKDQGFLFSTFFLQPGEYIGTIMNFCSWIIWGKTGGSAYFSPIIELASVLVSHGQYEASENLLLVANAHSNKKKESQIVQLTKSEWCTCLHLLGFCLLVRAHTGSYGTRKDEKIHEAVRCFFRVASGEGAHVALRNLSFQPGLPLSVETESATVWKFHYYQWAMQTFEQYNISDGACQFALAALEQVDEVASLTDGSLVGDFLPEPATTIRGRLWANVFKFTLDLNYYRDAYCAIISNPDDDSKYICLRRFIIVLCERSATKILCDGNLPFVGLLEKVEQELFWKAERSDITVKPNLYKLLYSFESYRSNWRKAASYMYRYTVRLRTEANFKEHHQLSLAFQERIWGLSAAISALQLVNPAYAWLDSQHGNLHYPDQYSPNKRARKTLEDNASTAVENHSSNTNAHIDIETLEKEYVLVSAQYLLVLVKDKSTLAENQTDLENTVYTLIHENFYDMAFTVLFKFWRGSALKKELEKIFIAISEKCCEIRAAPSFVGSDIMPGLLLTSSKDVHYSNGKADAGPVIHQPKANAQWETLEHYLEKYMKLHPWLPVTVAKTLLRSDPQIELPLWLVHMFKGGRRSARGMAGQEADPATLFRLYIDYGRYPEATNLLLEYLESFASTRPTEILNRKRMCAVWFPYVSIERLWCQLEEVQNSGHMVDQCGKLKGLLKGALLEHLKQMKLDSDDALAAALV